MQGGSHSGPISLRLGLQAPGLSKVEGLLDLLWRPSLDPEPSFRKK